MYFKNYDYIPSKETGSVFCWMGKDLNLCLSVCLHYAPRLTLPPENSVLKLTEMTIETHHVEEIYEALLNEQSTNQTHLNCRRNGFLEQKESRDKVRQ